MKYRVFDKCIPSRLYISQLPKKTYISVNKSGRLLIGGDCTDIIKELSNHIAAHSNTNFFAGNTISSIEALLQSIPEMQPTGYNNVVSFNAQPQRQPQKSYSEMLDTRDQKDFHKTALMLDIKTVKMKSATRKNISVVVDHREPDELFELLNNSQIDSVDVAQLPLGDIFATDGSSELIIERKTITDLTVSITGDEHRAHSQVERYYDYIQEQAAKGVCVKLIWIIEGENGVRSLYNSLPLVQGVDGMINYWIAISDQYVATSFNLNHTAYLTAKLIQGFFERTLPNPVKLLNGSRIDRRHAHSTNIAPEVDNTDRGVTRGSESLSSLLSYFPGVKSNVAKELASTGMSIKEILQMSESDLVKIKGISDKSARVIFDGFNMIN